MQRLLTPLLFASSVSVQDWLSCRGNMLISAERTFKSFDCATSTYLLAFDKMWKALDDEGFHSKVAAGT